MNTLSQGEEWMMRKMQSFSTEGCARYNCPKCHHLSDNSGSLCDPLTDPMQPSKVYAASWLVPARGAEKVERGWWEVYSLLPRMRRPLRVKSFTSCIHTCTHHSPTRIWGNKEIVTKAQTDPATTPKVRASSSTSYNAGRSCCRLDETLKRERENLLDGNVEGAYLCPMFVPPATYLERVDKRFLTLTNLQIPLQAAKSVSTVIFYQTRFI